MQSIHVTIEIETTKTFTIENQDDLADIAFNYDGDVEAWAIDNHNELFSVCSTEVNNVSYNRDNAKKVISAVEKENAIGMIDSYLIPEESITEQIKKDRKLIEIDKESLKIAIKYSDVRNPKVELNGVFLKGKDVVATDTRQLICVQSQIEQDEVFIPLIFAGHLIDNANARFYKYVLDDERDEKTVHYFLDVEGNTYCKTFYDFKYPNYNDILNTMQKDNIKKVELKQYLDGLTKDTADEIYYDNFILSEKYHNNLPLGKLKHLAYFEKHNPIHFVGDEVHAIIMPLVKS
jgi:hypothetical protein